MYGWVNLPLSRRLVRQPIVAYSPFELIDLLSPALQAGHAFVSLGAHTSLLALLHSPEHSAVYKALGALRGLAYERPAVSAQLVAAGALPPLLAALQLAATAPDVAEGSAKLLQFLACSDEIREAMVEAGTVEALVALLRQEDDGCAPLCVGHHRKVFLSSAFVHSYPSSLPPLLRNLAGWFAKLLHGGLPPHVAPPAGQRPHHSAHQNLPWFHFHVLGPPPCPLAPARCWPWSPRPQRAAPLRSAAACWSGLRAR